jgi:hypothetical protein
MVWIDEPATTTQAHTSPVYMEVALACRVCTYLSIPPLPTMNSRCCQFNNFKCGRTSQALSPQTDSVPGPELYQNSSVLNAEGGASESQSPGGLPEQLELFPTGSGLDPELGGSLETWVCFVI